MRRTRSTTRAGFSLVEALVTLVLLGVVMGALVGPLLASQRDSRRQRDALRAREAMRVAESTIGTIMRNAGANPLNTNLALIDPNPLNSSTFNNVRVTADFNPADGDVSDPMEDVQISLTGDSLFIRWQSGGASELSAYPIRSLLFQYYDRSGSEITVASQVTNATRVMITMTAPVSATSSVTLRRESWVALRNRT